MYLEFIKFNIKRIIEYKKDFLIGILPFIFTQCINLFVWKMIFSQIHFLDHWSLQKLVLFYGFTVMNCGFYSFIFGNLRNVKYYLYNGEFDLICVRPISPMYHLIMLGFQETAIEEILVGFLLICYSINKCNVELNAYKVILAVLTCSLGVVIMGSIAIICISFLFITKGTFTPYIAVFQLPDYMKYPLTIWKKPIQLLFTYGLPFAFISYYPSLIILYGKKNYRYFLIELLIAFGFGVIAKRFFHYAIGKYEGVSAM